MTSVDNKELSFVIKLCLLWSFPAPLVAPANVTGHNTSSTSIYVTWQPVSPDDVKIRGIHRGYSIYYVSRDTPRPSMLMNVTVDALTTHVQLTNLYKFTKYDIQVTVRTRWDGPKSTTITVSTDEGSKWFAFAEWNAFGMRNLQLKTVHANTRCLPAFQSNPTTPLVSALIPVTESR